MEPLRTRLAAIAGTAISAVHGGTEGAWPARRGSPGNVGGFRANRGRRFPGYRDFRRRREGATFGLDTAGTITAGAVTGFATDAALITGTAAAVFNSFANGNLNALSSFDLTRLVGLGATLAASKLPFVGRFAETVGYAAEQATAAVQEAQAACQ